MMCQLESWIFPCFLMVVIISIGSAATMFIATYPGDECLLFVSVRGEALIYGNPAGCHFIAIGHCFILCGTIALVIMIYHASKPNRRESIHEGEWKNHSGSKKNLVYNGKVLTMVFLITGFISLIAIVAISGYQVSCHELQYERRRLIYGQIPLGSPIKSINIACYSLFHDVDFHTRFHFDHYEYSGQWHGQYRGYNHGRVRTNIQEHEHIINVGTAIELAIAGSFLSLGSWIAIMIVILMIRKRQKKAQFANVVSDMGNGYSSIGLNSIAPQNGVMDGTQSFLYYPEYPNIPASSSINFQEEKLLTQNVERSHHSLQLQPPLQVQGSSNDGIQYVQMQDGLLVPVIQNSFRNELDVVSREQMKQASLSQDIGLKCSVI